jgi:RNA polymerase sigma factor (sigma-70 family)
MRHRPTAVALATRVLGSVDLAGDAVQDATVVAMVSLDRLRSADRFGPWLCGIALNVSRRWLRELRTVPLSPDDGHLAVTTDTDTDEQVEVAELAAAVRRAVAGLANG